MNRHYFLPALVSTLLLGACATSRPPLPLPPVPEEIPIDADGVLTGLTAKEMEDFSYSFTKFELDVASDAVVYTIDISTEDGRVKLEGLTLKQAQMKALTEAAIKHNAALLVMPKFDNYIYDNHILRVTVSGFPARFKNTTKTEK